MANRDYETHTTYAWSKEQLVHEKYWYLAKDRQIEEVYFPGGITKKVIWQGNGLGEMEGGIAFRLPKRIREFDIICGC